VQCRIAHCFPFKFTYLERQIMSAATARRRMTPQNAVAVLSRFGKTAMTEHSLWRFSRALHGAINQRQLHDLDDLIDEDVQWAIYGPIDMFPFLGARRGKPAVLEVIRQISENFQLHRFDRETIMLGTDTAASILRYSLTALDSNKPISVRLAHFAQFKTGRLASIRVVVDTFDLVEQVLGQPIHLPKMG
jgi:ketosteroid isomerase-like protein